MREILFRGKRIDNGEWVEGGICDYGGGVSMFVVNHYAGSFYEPPYTDLDEVDVVPSTVGQYTGLEDNNGKMIFEGDIVRYPVYQGTFRGENIHQVVFERRGGSAYFGITMDDVETWYFCMSVPADLMEVIGNIHDNPELIGGEKK